MKKFVVFVIFSIILLDACINYNSTLTEQQREFGEPSSELTITKDYPQKREPKLPDIKNENQHDFLSEAPSSDIDAGEVDLLFFELYKNERNDSKYNEPTKESTKEGQIPYGCPKNIKVCPNYKTSLIFPFKSTKKKPTDSIYINWIGNKNGNIYILETREYIGIESPKNYQSTMYAYSIATGGILWKVPIGEGQPILPRITNSAKVVAGVYQTNKQGQIRTIIGAIESKTGVFLWTKIFNNQTFQRPTTHNNTVFLADSELIVLDSDSGKIAWRKPLDSRNPKNVIVSYHKYGPAIDNNYIYSISRSGRLYCFDHKGNLQWSKSVFSKVQRWFGAIGNNSNLYAYNGYNIFSISKTGNVNWKYPPENATYKTIETDLQITIDSKENLYFLDISIDSTGKSRWTSQPRVQISHIRAPIISKNTIIYCGNTKFKEINIYKKSGVKVDSYSGYPNYNNNTGNEYWSRLTCTHNLYDGNKMIVYLTNNVNKDGNKYVFLSITLPIHTLEGYAPLVLP